MPNFSTIRFVTIKSYRLFLKSPDKKKKKKKKKKKNNNNNNTTVYSKFLGVLSNPARDKLINK